MTLWIVLTAMIAAAAAALAVALTHRAEARRDRPGEAEALRADLVELEAQAAAGLLPARTAESLRAETLRRFLGEGGPQTELRRTLGRRAQMGLAIGVSLVVALGAAWLYARLGRPELAAPAPPSAAAGPEAQVGQLIPQLEAKVRANADPAGLRLLGNAYMDVGRWRDAAADFGRLAALDPRDADARSAQGEALVRADSGVVDTPAADAFRAALALAPDDPRARWFLALRKDQQGDHAGAMNDWIALLKSAPPGAPWAAQVRQFVEQSAAQHHEDVSARLPPETPAAEASPAATGGGAGAPPPMVAAMVERLDARLKAQPRDLQGWIMMMRARMVLGEPAAAAKALAAGRATFADSAPDQATLEAAAKSLGVPGS